MNTLFLRARVSAITAALMLACALISSPSQAATWKVIEKFSDGCDEDVSIKKPYADAPSLDANDVLLCRSAACKLRVEGSPPTHLGRVASANGTSDWTERAWLRPVPTNSDRYFRWFCGVTRERSRCASGTDAITVRLKSPGAFETRCWDLQP